MSKPCPQCKRMKPMVVRWFAHNFGQIPWNGFRLPREKRAEEEILKKIEEFALDPEQRGAYDHLLKGHISTEPKEPETNE